MWIKNNFCILIYFYFLIFNIYRFIKIFYKSAISYLYICIATRRQRGGFALRHNQRLC